MGSHVVSEGQTWCRLAAERRPLGLLSSLPERFLSSSISVEEELLSPASAADLPLLPLLLPLSHTDPAIFLQTWTFPMPPPPSTPASTPHFLSPTFACVYPSGTLHCINQGFSARRCDYSISTHSLSRRRTKRQEEKGEISINIAGAQRCRKCKFYVLRGNARIKER